VVRGSTWLNQGLGRGSGGSLCRRRVEAGSQSMKAVGCAGVGLRHCLGRGRWQGVQALA
jgi:hypothetical protein